MKSRIDAELDRIHRLVLKSADSYKELIEPNNPTRYLTEHGAEKYIHKLPFILFGEYMKLFEYYDVKSEKDKKLIQRSLKEIRKKVLQIVNPKNVTPSESFNTDTEQFIFDEYTKNYNLISNEFSQNVEIIRHRIDARFRLERNIRRTTWIPIIIAIFSAVISVVSIFVSVFNH